MTQTEARRRALLLGGVAVEARWSNDHWLIGGWPNHPDAVWIVVDPHRRWILDAPEVN